MTNRTEKSQRRTMVAVAQVFLVINFEVLNTKNPFKRRKNNIFKLIN